MLIYDDFGEGEVLVLLHGIGAKKETWVNQMELSQHYRLIIPDLYSTSKEVEGSIVHMAEGVIHLLEYLGIEKAHFCGVSLGGLVLHKIATLKKELIASAFLSNTFFCNSRYSRLFLYDKPIQFFWELNQPYSVKYLFKFLSDSNYYQQPYFNQYFHMDKELYLSTFHSMMKLDQMIENPLLDIPTLVLASKRDKVVPYRMMQHIYLMNPSAQIIPTFLSGHFIHIDHPSYFNEQLLSFLSMQQQKVMI